MGEDAASRTDTTKLVAFHLPQFYPTPYNDEWWGKGFTEWTNVTKARPRFRGHYQPHLPADLGFYDLRLPEARDAQAALASEYGIYGFCYYHYWFNGKMLLERPVDEILRLGTPDFPFCLCWANENWTRAWDGRDKQVLMGQAYSDEDDMSHIRWLAKAFADSRYIRVDSRPLFLVYRSARLPDPKRTTDRWREEAIRLGVGDLYLCHVENIFGESRVDPNQLGFDAAVEFQPKLRLLRPPLTARVKGKLLPNRQNFQVNSYAELVKKSLAEPSVPYLRYPGVCPSWDNTARRPNSGLTLKGSTPELYEHWLHEVIKRAPVNSDGDKIVFINAWNEWAEACHLEPCQKWGRQYLEATARALKD
jgi:lipopolysaccharide biosynthesis protein